jgi:hypothetical protein
MTHLRYLLAMLTTVAALTACNLTPSSGHFDAENFAYGNCESTVLPWEPGFFAVDAFADPRNQKTVATIRLQDQGGGIERIDGIFIQIDDAYVLAAGRDEIPLGVPDENGYTPARATMGFYASCPNEGVVPELRGTIRFTFYGTQNDDQISARIDAPIVVDERVCREEGNNVCEHPDRRLGTKFQGRFSFIVEGGRPYQNFTGPRNRQ